MVDAGSTSSTQPSRLDKLRALAELVRAEFSISPEAIKTWVDEHRVELLQVAALAQPAMALGGVSSAAVFQHVDQVQAEQAKMDADAALANQLTEEEHHAILDKLRAFVQRPVGHLQTEEELYMEQQLSDMLGFTVTAELDGNRLNHTIGIMGGEQHLRRFPTDTLEQHDAYRQSGIAPNRGAFGWFTENGQLTDQAIQREKYYFAVQTLYLPNWNTEHPKLKEWYKFRKMIAINPADEVAVVAVVGDAGPAQWVQKQYGGSPEVINEGKIWSKQAHGRVILLFVDDPEDKIPLGVISLKSDQVLAKLRGQGGKGG